ncbi:PEPxxWA-CTERM sorting domain-containing protein [Sphingomonas nostoxanthinifaciens]|uniref:PEPxxWA-CTERM sorting domain-containing protein n=1 Tax=Sphingomonas nostoxanthinifaciens TaxID=2872652 RepID=UPI001CC1CCF7|nr:PEPxxWA-CTERM sorting domain-containing protein [Sphingomonas nostoxanthinifaciens]UAK23133.1 PEPxxWA-CTERM sorting domain-containing protein [Sphingomonas nostoxanthinifaciens]
MNRAISSALVVTSCIAGLAASPAMAVDLTGASIGVTWLFPDSSTVYQSQTFVAGPGVELTCPGGSVGGGLCSGFVDASTIDLGVDTLSLTITDGTSSWTSPAFNGYEFSGLSAHGAIAGYSLATSFAGLDDSRISFTGDSISVNMEGISPVAGQSFTITLLDGAVPEASSWAMFVAGFGLVGAAVRNRRGKVSLA